MGSPGGATTSECRVDLIGGFWLGFHDRVVELPLGAQRLISYLALEGSWVTRSYVAEMLWSDSRRRQAAANLRTGSVIQKARQTLGLFSVGATWAVFMPETSVVVSAAIVAVGSAAI